MTDEETALVNQVMAENKAAKEQLAAQAGEIRAALDEIASLKGKLRASGARGPAPASAGPAKSFHVRVLAAGGVILPNESEATPKDMTVKVVQQPAREGHAHIDVERALRHLEKHGHVSVEEIRGG